jgi:hypothetical protein
LSGEPGRKSIQYPGGLSVRYRWASTGQAADVFALTEAGGRLDDHGALVSAQPDRLCRAELRVEGPNGIWTARLASPIYDEPDGLLWDVPLLLVVRYGFLVYAFQARIGELRWTIRAGTPVVALLASSRLDHVLVQTEIETLAVREDSSVSWRVAHNDAVVEAELVGGRLVLTSYGGQHQTLDASTGQPLP